MLELIVVIVVFGIVASIGADILSSLYNNYLRTRSVNRMQTQVEVTLDHVAKLFSHRIKDSVRASQDSGTTWLALSDPNTGSNTYNHFSWIGISNDSFLGEHNGTTVVPGWSDLLDFDSSSTNKADKRLSTPGSRLDFANNIIASLTNDLNMSNAGSQKPAIFFRNPKVGYDVNQYFTNNGYGYPVSRHNDTTFEFSTAHIPVEISDQYYLSHTAYALVPDGAEHNFNLVLRYNFQPWHNEDFNSTSASSSVFAEHVSAFKMRQVGDTIKIKLCIHDNNQSYGDFNFGFCKEKVVF